FGSFKHAKGQVFVLYAILYSTARFFLEFLRGDYVNLTLGLKSAQMTSLIAIIVGICVFIYLGYLEKKNQKVLVTTEPIVKTKKRK
ncbi:MAG: prolipoprotein diacylglyceryl transferase, partial [Streptococcus sp.]|nr:prolipoprotein diacylglyceryl transferase [Streptococcus sp.]